jgi:hypothetical protein
MTARRKKFASAFGPTTTGCWTTPSRKSSKPRIAPGPRVAGPVLLPTQIKKYTVNRSVHTDKKSREQFEMRVHKRLIDIWNRRRKRWKK